MTIAKRLVLLLAVPLLVILSLGVATRMEMARVEQSTRFVAETRVVALARLGDISRTFADMRVAIRGFLLDPDPAVRAAARRI